MSWFRWEPKTAGLVSSSIIKARLKELCPKAYIGLDDREYRIPADPSEVFWKCSPVRYKYIPGKRDCEDFARMALGWLSRKAMGDLLVFKVNAYPQTGFGHCMIGTLKNGEIILGEPKTGRISSFKEGYEIKRIIA